MQIREPDIYRMGEDDIIEDYADNYPEILVKEHIEICERIPTMPDTELVARGDWLLEKFGSYEYYQEMLGYHAEYMEILHRHWQNKDLQEKYPDLYDTMKSPVFFNLDRVPKPNEEKKEHWQAGVDAGWSNAIIYNFGGRGMGDLGFNNEWHPLIEMDKVLFSRVRVLVSYIRHMCTHIVKTADKRWDSYEDILYYSGPIDWPVDWGNQLVSSRQRCEGGQKCPQAGEWWSPAFNFEKRSFDKGDTMPVADNKNWATFWYMDK